MTNKFISKSVSRYFAIQIFYTLEFSYDFKETLNGFLEENKIDIHLTFKKKLKKSMFNKNYFLDILQTYDEQKVRVDDLIKSNLGQNWNLDRLPKVLLSILRVAVSEMLSKNNVSIGIIISEYVMFTESFFTKKECAFANAILDKIFVKLNFNEEKNGH